MYHQLSFLTVARTVAEALNAATTANLFEQVRWVNSGITQISGNISGTVATVSFLYSISIYISQYKQPNL